jgi:hypothetical protein
MSSKGKKFDAGKPMVSLVPSQPVIEIAKVMTFGAKKYAAHNWRNGLNWSRVADATLRHFLAWKEGEDFDPESGLLHLAHAGCNLMFLLEYQTNPVYQPFDDRFKKSGNIFLPAIDTEHKTDRLE